METFSRDRGANLRDEAAIDAKDSEIWAVRKARSELSTFGSVAWIKWI